MTYFIFAEIPKTTSRFIIIPEIGNRYKSKDNEGLFFVMETTWLIMPGTRLWTLPTIILNDNNNKFTYQLPDENELRSIERWIKQ